MSYRSILIIMRTIDKLYIVIIVLIPIITLLYFGIDDKTAGYFDPPNNEKDNDFIADYLYQVGIYGDHPKTYPYGLMVSHYANIVIVSIIAEILATIVFVGIKECRIVSA